MSHRMKEKRNTAVMAKGLRELFGKWAEEEAEGLYEDEPSWQEVKSALDEERGREGASRRLFPEA